MVWIEVMPGMFESRTVKTGIENKQFVEIKKGANSSMGGMKM